MALIKTKNIAITGSTNWQDKTKLKTTIFQLKQTFGSKVRVIGCGAKLGADPYIKKYSLDFDLDYAEFPPYDQQWNHYCIKPAYLYNKSKSHRYYGMRNSQLAKEADILIVFVMDCDEYKPYQDLIDQFQKRNKKVIVVK